jgi:hypothetical protein
VFIAAFATAIEEAKPTNRHKSLNMRPSLLAHSGISSGHPSKLVAAGQEAQAELLCPKMIEPPGRLLHGKGFYGPLNNNPTVAREIGSPNRSRPVARALGPPTLCYGAAVFAVHRTAKTGSGSGNHTH